MMDSSPLESTLSFVSFLGHGALSQSSCDMLVALRCPVIFPGVNEHDAFHFLGVWAPGSLLGC